MLTFENLREANVKRCNQFHEINSWSPTDWACAMAGECGECCNDIKKLRRLQTSPEWNNEDSRDAKTIIERAGLELADVVIYADLLAARLGIDLAAVIQEKFNAKSREIGSDVIMEQ